ncbi:Nocturnin [Porphyridium purpureum]|uniref:Nocturnin n=1 Tax=Porphyridium purpureum TaxID=35688 RepID=A0A5J4Z1W3_PORPP|nr:Nocturnin [Porphyridium purpureum]|eukprot:POR6637..scf295_1
MDRPYVKYAKEPRDVTNSSPAFPLRIMQWNILAQSLATNESFPYVPEQAVSAAPLRLALIVEQIRTYTPDVVCLEEVDRCGAIGVDQIASQLCEPDVRTGFCLTLGASGFRGDEAKGTGIGVCVFVNPARVRIVANRVMKFGDVGDPQLVLLCLAETVSSQQSRRFGLAATHLKAKVEFAAVRQRQMQMLLAALNSGSMIPQGCALVVAGDFNAEPSETAVEMALGSEGRLLSLYGEILGDINLWTTWKIRDKELRRCIDYIFYRDGDTDQASAKNSKSGNNGNGPESSMADCDCCRSIAPVGCFAQPSDEQIPATRLPSVSFPSDHLNLIADICLY